MYFFQCFAVYLCLCLCNTHKYSLCKVFCTVSNSAVVYYCVNIIDISVYVGMSMFVAMLMCMCMVMIVYMVVIMVVVMLMNMFMLMVVMMFMLIMAVFMFVSMLMVMMFVNKFAVCKYNINVLSTYAAFFRSSYFYFKTFNIKFCHFCKKCVLIKTKVKQCSQCHISAYTGKTIKI